MSEEAKKRLEENRKRFLEIIAKAKARKVTVKKEEK